MGPCVNNLPVRVRLDLEQPAIAAWLAELHERNLEIAQHQYASLSDIQEWAGVPWRLRLFDSLVVFQNYLVDEAVRRWGAVDVEPLAAPEATNYPLTLTVTPGAEIEPEAARPGEPCSQPRRSRPMLDGLATVLSSLARHPDSLLSEIESSLPASTKGGAPPRRPPSATAGDVRRSRQRDGARRRRGLGGAVPGRPGGHGRQLLRSRRPLDPPSPSPRAAPRADEGRPVRRRVAPVPDGPLSRPVPQRRRHLEPRRSVRCRDRAEKQRQALARRRSLQGKR